MWGGKARGDEDYSVDPEEGCSTQVQHHCVDCHWSSIQVQFNITELTVRDSLAGKLLTQRERCPLHSHCNPDRVGLTVEP